MKLWKRTVLLMLVTLLCALIPVGTLSLYITGKRSLNNAAETYGRQLENGKILLEQFWDNSKYEQMSETGKQAYMGFQFQRCCGEGMALIDRKSNAVIENLTDYKVVGLENLGLKDEGDPYAYKIQKLGQKYLLLQLEPLSRPEGYEVLSVREVTGLFAELRQTAVWFLGIYLAVFLIAGLFIYMMMRRTVEQMEKLQEVAEKQELLMGALSHEMRTPLTSIIGYSDTLRHVKLKDEQKDRALEHINREGKRLEALSGKMLQMLGLYQNHAIQMEMTMAGDLLNHVIDMENKVGTIINAEVYQIWKKEMLLLDDEGNELLLPKTEQIPSDFYRKGETARAVVARVDNKNNNPKIILSRTSPVFLQRLFEMEVPEINDGLITIKKIARIPGERAKIAVESYDDRIDPVGACVGVKGSRIHGIVRELRNENIDVINYTSNISLFIQRALSPAKISSIRLNEEEKKAEVFLKPEEVSLAIGKGGLNIKLASMLTEYTIDVFRELDENVADEDIYLDEFRDEIDGWVIDAIKAIGIDTAKAVLNAPREMLIEKTDLEEETVDEVIRILKSEFEEEEPEEEPEQGQE